MIYADYNSSAPLLPEIIDYLGNRLKNGPYANPNAIHSLGQKMSRGIEKCRSICAKHLGADPTQIFFNSGASEGIAHVFHTVLDEKIPHKNIVITSELEHSAVVSSCAHYARKGYEIVKIKTLSSGIIDMDDFKAKFKTHQNHIALVCVMAANNETGVIQPWQAISKLCNENKIPYFSDTTQYIGKTEFHFNDSDLDYAVLSGHKIGAIIGSGIILVKEPHKLKAHIFGGGQESGARGGTQNYIGIETLAIALTSFAKNKTHLHDVTKLREGFEKNIKAALPKVVIVGADAERLASTTLIGYPGIHGQAVQIELETNDIFVSTSSACSDNEPETSKVLKAMGISDDIGRAVVRISLCLEAKPESYAKIEEVLKKAYYKLGKIEF